MTAVAEASVFPTAGKVPMVRSLWIALVFSAGTGRLVLVLCWRSFGAARQKAGAWCSLEAGFELLAANKMLCEVGWVMLPALAANLSVETSLRPPVSLMRRLSPAFLRLSKPLYRAIFKRFRHLFDFSSPRHVD